MTQGAAPLSSLSGGLCRYICPLNMAAKIPEEPDTLNQQGESRDVQTVKTLLWLGDFAPNCSPPAKAALMRYLRTTVGSPRYLELVKHFGLRELAPELTDLALAQPEEAVGVQAAQLLIDFDRVELLAEAVHGNNVPKSIAALTVRGHVGGWRCNEILLPIITPTRAAATGSKCCCHLARSQPRTALMVSSGRKIQNNQTVVGRAARSR